MRTLRTSSVLRLIVAVALFAIVESGAPATAQWTPIGRGIFNTVPGKHHACGRIKQSAWRRDDSQGQNVLWMGTASGGLWKSIVNPDGSVQKWIPLTDNFPGPHEMGSFIVNRTNSSMILIGPGDVGGSKGDGNIYRTHDQGGHWYAHKLPLHASESAPKHVNRIVEDRSDPTGNTVLAGTSVGIYRGVDFGQTWKRASILHKG